MRANVVNPRSRVQLRNTEILFLGRGEKIPESEVNIVHCSGLDRVEVKRIHNALGWCGCSLTTRPQIKREVIVINLFNEKERVNDDKKSVIFRYNA
jgi:hypothetical protein